MYRTKLHQRPIMLLTALLACLNCVNAQAQYGLDDMSATELQKWAAGYFRPLKPRTSQLTAQESLGEKLFFDKNLSKHRNISCASCHPLKKRGPGADGLPVSIGTSGSLGSRNTPTVLNIGFHKILFWDGRAQSLAEQAREPLLAAKEMGMETEQAVLERLQVSKVYRDAFAKVYALVPSATITFAHVIEAIAAYQQSLVSTNRYDDYANGQLDALSQQELRGFKRFVQHDCKDCHSGTQFGGQNTDMLGIKHPYPDQSDLGIFSLSGKSYEKMHFKVASLRNVGLTAPYFHNGKVSTLEEAVRLMAWHQKGIKLSQQDIDDISAFLRALSDKRRAKKISKNKK